MRLDRFKTSEETPLVPLAAMIDVLFLMIIFLVLGASFDPVVSVSLPHATGGEPAPDVVRVELRMDGQLSLEGKVLPEAETLEILRRTPASTILLLPDGKTPVELLFCWYERLQQELGIPVSVGVRPPGS